MVQHLASRSSSFKEKERERRARGLFTECGKLGQVFMQEDESTCHRYKIKKIKK
jgi:hypothetical protein